MLNLKIVPLEGFNPPRQLAFRLLKAEQPGEAGMVCLALEDMEVPELKSSHQATSAEPAGTSALLGDVNAVQERLKRVGQGDLDLMSCDASSLAIIWTVVRPQGLRTGFDSKTRGHSACPTNMYLMQNTKSSASFSMRWKRKT